MKFKPYFLALLFLVSTVSLSAQQVQLLRSTPEQMGVESQKVIDMIDCLMAIDDTEIHHLMVVRDSVVIAEVHPEPFRAEHIHTLYSCSKAFVSLAIGIAIDENRLRLNDRVAVFFPELLPEDISQNLASITIKDLLTMASGVTPNWEYRGFEREWVAPFLGSEVGVPGEKFGYDSMCTFMLSAILQRVTGGTTLEYLRRELFTPMGITEADWEESLEGINSGGWGLRLSAESLAKIGVLYLNKGEWNGERLVSQEWIEESAKKQIETATSLGQEPTNGNQGYGYALWRCRYDGAFRADGAFGQFIAVMPQEDIVVVLLGLSSKTADELNAIWDNLLDGVHSESLAASSDSEKLEELCDNAALPTVGGKTKSRVSAQVVGRKFEVEENSYNISSITIQGIEGGYSLLVEDNDGGGYTLDYGFGDDWKYNHTELTPPYKVNSIANFCGLEYGYTVAGTCGWTSKNTLTLKSVYVDFISSRTLEFDFSDMESIGLAINDNFPGSQTETISIF